MGQSDRQATPGSGNTASCSQRNLARRGEEIGSEWTRATCTPVHCPALPCRRWEKVCVLGVARPNRVGNKAVSHPTYDTKRRQRPNVSVLLHQFRAFNVLLFRPALLAPSRQLFRLEADLYSVPFPAVPRWWRGLARRLRRRLRR